jgi:hypothetical protein
VKILSGRWGWNGDDQVFRVRAIAADGRFVVLECASPFSGDIATAARLAGVS